MKLKSIIKITTGIAMCGLLFCITNNALASIKAESTKTRNRAKTNQSITIAAHRGYWKCEEAGFAQNSIAALKAAQENKFEGSEFDVHLSKDGEIIVNHDPDIQGHVIEKTNSSLLRSLILKNGEHVPTLEEYLLQGKKSKKTALVLEIKCQSSKEREDILTDKCIAALKKHKLFKPKRVIFISFSLNVCQKLAKQAPGFMVQYLSGNIAPAQLHKMGITGIDYSFHALRKHPEWIKEAQDLGMVVNCWTVNNTKDIEEMINLGVDCITTNEPLKVRNLLKD